MAIRNIYELGGGLNQEEAHPAHLQHLLEL